MKSLVELLDSVGDERMQPPLPEGGLKKQWFPSPLRLCIKLLIYPFMMLDIFAKKIALRIVPPPFKITGSCKKRGNCCHYILLRTKSKKLSLLSLFWHTQINGFFLRSKKADNVMGKNHFVMGCRYLRKDGSCSNYILRPALCRNWPDVGFRREHGILKGCGFQVREKSK